VDFNGTQMIPIMQIFTVKHCVNLVKLCDTYLVDSCSLFVN